MSVDEREPEPDRAAAPEADAQAFKPTMLIFIVAVIAAAIAFGIVMT